MKKYLISQLTQVSAWIGVCVILAAFFAPRSVIVVLGVLLILTDDEWLRAFVTKSAPKVEKKINEFGR